MAKKKDSFVAYYDWEDACADFTNEQFGELFRAIYAYEKRGEAYAGDDPAIKIVIRLIYGTLDRNREKYEAICERNRRNGAKGGAPKNNQNAKKQPKQPKGTQNNPKQPSGGQNNPKQPEHEREHEREREYDRDRENEHDTAGGAISFFRREFPGDDSDALDRSIREACDTVGEEMVMEAMRTAVQQGKRSWGYCKGILNNWQRQGGPHPKPRNALQVARPPTPEEEAEQARRIEENQRWMREFLESPGAEGHQSYCDAGHENGGVDT